MRFYTQFTDHKKQSGINHLVNSKSPPKNKNSVHDFHTTLILTLEANEDEEDIILAIKKQLAKEKPTLLAYFVYSANQEQSWFDKLRCVFAT